MVLGLVVAGSLVLGCEAAKQIFGPSPAFWCTSQSPKAPVFSEEEKADARKAIELILAATDKAISLDGGEANLYYLRGNTYAQRYYDAKNAEDKEKALADLQKAVDMGLAAAQSAYDMLVGQ